MTGCFLAEHGVYERGPMPPCDGTPIRAHLIPQQLLKRTALVRNGEIALYDPRLWRWACGGIMGCTGHHGMLDYAKTLRLPAEAIDAELRALAVDLDVEWYLDRVYLPRTTLEGFWAGSEAAA